MAVLASIAAMIYVMEQYRLRTSYAVERSQYLQLSQELQEDVKAYLVYFNGTYVELKLYSQFPYSYQVDGLSLRLVNGSPLLVSSSGGLANVTVIGPYGIIYGLPASAGPAQWLTIIVKLNSRLEATQRNMVILLQSGDSMAAISVTSYVTPATQVSVNPYNSTSVQQLIGTKVVSTLISVVSPSEKIAIPKVYTIVNLTPIILYNPTGEATPKDLTVNFTINLNSEIVKYSSISVRDGSGLVPLANVLFAIWNGTGWDPLNGWIELYNSTEAEVWVRLDRQILPYSNLTIYMLFLNGSTLGTVNWGVNSYYTQNLSTDNIAYVMQEGLLYQIYVDENGTLYGSGGGIGAAVSHYCNSRYGYAYSMVGFSYVGLAHFIYSLPLFNAIGTFASNYSYCVLYSGSLSQSLLYYSPTNATITFVKVSNARAERSYEFGLFTTDVINGTFISYGEPSVSIPANEPVYDWQGYIMEGYDVEFNFQDGFEGGQPWPYGLYESQQQISWLVKSVGWADVRGPGLTVATTTDDGTAIVIRNTPGGGPFTDWLGSWPGVGSVLLPVWATDYGWTDWQSPVTFEAPLNATVSSMGDYRVVVLYYQDIGTDTYFAVFVPSISMSSNIAWYSPVFPSGGSYPYVRAPLAPNLLLGPQSVVQGWIVG